MDRSVSYFTFTQKLMSFAGLWHTQTHKQRLLRYCVFGFMSLHTILNELCQLLTSNFDLRSAVRLLQVFVPSICGITMYYHCASHFKTIQKIYSYILQDSQLLKDDNELKIMQKYTYYGNLYTFTAAAIAYVYLLTNITSSLLRIILSTNEIRSDLDLFPIISCFDYFSSRETYSYPIILFQVMTTFVLVTVSLACYSKFFTFILHACARLSIIKYKICLPFIHDNHNDDIAIIPIDLSPWIIDIVQCLARMTKYMTLVNAAFEKNYLFQIFLAFLLLILAFLCVPLLLEHKSNMTDMLELASYISGILFTIYVNCYVGQKLMDYSSEVYREVSLVPFHEMSLKTQKLLLTTLTMSVKPYVASIGKVYVSSHDFFNNLLRSSLSFAMVVHSLQTI